MAAKRLPAGFRRGHGDDLACPHRDVSCCPACAVAHVEIVEVYGQHYWIADEAERDLLIAEMAHELCDLVVAQPYEARLCPECGVWIFTAAGPFAEGDRTKTLADTYHYEREHADKVTEHGPGVVGFPYMHFNETVVSAVQEV